MEHGKKMRRLTSLVESTITEAGTTTFRGREDAEAWIRAKSKEHGSQAKLTSSEEYKEMYPEIERAYKASEDAANDLAWEEFAKIGVRKGSTVTARVAVVRHYLGGHGIVKATGKVGADKHGRPVLKTKEGVDLPGKRRPVKTFHITADAVVR